MLELVGMAYSDRDVYRTLKALIEQHGSDAIISQNAIAAAAGVPLRTVQYSLHRLMVTGRVSGEFTPGLGYRYRIRDERPAER